jgi:hypothetical protein
VLNSIRKGRLTDKAARERQRAGDEAVRLHEAAFSVVGQRMHAQAERAMRRALTYAHTIGDASSGITYTADGELSSQQKQQQQRRARRRASNSSIAYSAVTGTTWTARASALAMDKLARRGAALREQVRAFFGAGFAAPLAELTAMSKAIDDAIERVRSMVERERVRRVEEEEDSSSSSSGGSSSSDSDEEEDGEGRRRSAETEAMRMALQLLLGEGGLLQAQAELGEEKTLLLGRFWSCIASESGDDRGDAEDAATEAAGADVAAAAAPMAHAYCDLDWWASKLLYSVEYAPRCAELGLEIEALAGAYAKFVEEAQETDAEAEDRYTIHSSPTLLSYTPSHTLLSYTPLIHSSHTLSYTGNTSLLSRTGRDASRSAR